MIPLSRDVELIRLGREFYPQKESLRTSGADPSQGTVSVRGAVGALDPQGLVTFKT
jgi:hypothetical protein